MVTNHSNKRIDIYLLGVVISVTDDYITVQNYRIFRVYAIIVERVREFSPKFLTLRTPFLRIRDWILIMLKLSIITIT